jgi:hypothetical protein
MWLLFHTPNHENDSKGRNKGDKNIKTIESGESSLLIIILDFIIMHTPMCALKNTFLFHDKTQHVDNINNSLIQMLHSLNTFQTIFLCIIAL